MRATLQNGIRRAAVAQRTALIQRPFARNNLQVLGHQPPASTAPTQTAPFSSEAPRNDRPYRPWLDSKLPPEVRVKKFSEVELGALGKQAVFYDTVDLADRCCRFQDFVGMKLAHDVLDRSLAEKRHFDNNRSSPEQGPLIVPPMLFQKIMFGWANMAQKGRIAQERMRELVELMVQVSLEEEATFKRANDANNPDGMRTQPTTNLYNTYLTGIRNAAKASPKAAFTVWGVLGQMIDNHQQYGWHTKPNTKSYSLAVSAFANAKMRNAGIEAEKVLRRMQQAHQEEKAIYLEEYGVPYDTENPDNNKRRIVTADAIIYTYVIQAHAKAGTTESATKSRDLLIEVMDVKDGTVKADLGLLTGVMASFAKVAENSRVSKAVRYTACQQAEELLDVWMSDTETQQATMEGLDVVAPFNACMNAYAKCGQADAALKAESILQRLLSDFTEGRSSIHPDTVSFNTVLNAWARSITVAEAPKKAEELMRLQMQLVESEVLPESAKPDTVSFSIVMLAYAKSKDPEKVQHAYRLLHEVIQQYAEGQVSDPSKLVVAFTSVLNAAAFPAQREASCDGTDSDTSPSGSTLFETEATAASTTDDYSIALQAYRELKDDVFQIGVRPDHFVFAKMLLVIGAHTDDTSAERRQMVQLIFEDACKAGEVSKLVLKSLFQVIVDKQFVGVLLQNEDLAFQYVESVDFLPRLWTRNVKHEHRYMRRPDPRSEQGRRKGLGRSTPRRLKP